MCFKARQDGLLLDGLSKTTDVATTLQVVSLQVKVAVVFLSSSRKYRSLVEVFDTLERVYRDHQCKTSEVKFTVKFRGICFTTVILVSSAPFIHDGIYPSEISQCCWLIYSWCCCTVQKWLCWSTSHTMINARIQKELMGHVIERMEINNSLPNVDETHANRKVKKLRTLMNTYWMLCEAVHQANVFYCDQLMVGIFTSFVQITITSYYFFLFVRVGNVLSSLLREPGS
ncbi:hypothetical protein J6590_053355 [Homalodisca vitripennis]|nr:hypothetical protein J6590_053355 [Homalodisca vitripennis]